MAVLEKSINHDGLQLDSTSSNENCVELNKMPDIASRLLLDVEENKTFDCISKAFDVAELQKISKYKEVAHGNSTR